MRQQQNQRQTTTNANANAAGATGEERDSQFSDFMTIIADERTNSLVISGTRSDLELIREMIDRLDVLLPQVLIEAVIVDVTITDGYSRGSDVLGLGFTQLEDKTQLLSLGTGAALGITGSVNSSPATSAFNIFGVNIGGSQIGAEDGEIGAGVLNLVLEKASENSNVKVVSAPTILTTHNKEATILVGQAQPIVTSTQSTFTTSDSVRSNFQFEDIAITLLVKPLIGPNDVIQLEVEQTFDEVAGSVDIGGETQPIIGRREASSTISMKNGELAILGGLQREVKNKSESRPTLIGSVPLLGSLFRKKAETTTRSELMVFIRPTVMRTTDETRELSSDLVERLSAKESIEHFVETGELDASIGEEKDDKKEKIERKDKGPQGK